MAEETQSTQRVKFYQTGTFTVGNRLLDESQRSVQASVSLLSNTTTARAAESV
jgi:pyruvate ferredoxin oxidoreductase beta subunit